MAMNLYARKGDYKTHKILITANYAGLEIATPAGNSGAPETGRIPVLETKDGCIFSTFAIARYIARINRPVGLYGQNLIEGGMIDSWLEFCTHELEVPLCTWVLPKLGVFPEIPEATASAKEDVKKALSVLDKHLLHNTYMVGHTITLADISLCCALLDGMKLVLDDGFRKPYGNLMRWFNTCAQQPEFASVIGNVVLCGGGAKAPAPKQNDKKKEEQAGGKKKEPEPKKAAKGQADGGAPKDAPKDAAPKKEGKKKGGGDKAPETVAPEKAASAAQPAAEDPEKARKDKLKKVIKEGGKRGVEIEGAADMGGLQFFCTSMDLPEGDLELLRESMRAMNAESDPTEEERKGGSGRIGKMIFSAGAEQLAIVAYVPEAKQGELSCEEWLRDVLGMFGGEVVATGKSECTGFVKTDGDKNVFPLKIREPMIITANNFLRKKGLFPDDDDDDDDEMVFGDDDFPS